MMGIIDDIKLQRLQRAMTYAKIAASQAALYMVKDSTKFNRQVVPFDLESGTYNVPTSTGDVSVTIEHGTGFAIVHRGT